MRRPRLTRPAKDVWAVLLAAGADRARIQIQACVPTERLVLDMAAAVVVLVVVAVRTLERVVVLWGISLKRLPMDRARIRFCLDRVVERGITGQRLVELVVVQCFYLSADPLRIMVQSRRME